MKYNRWTVLQEGIKRGTGIYCLCKCDCGNEGLVKKHNLINGKSKSCGCLQKELLREKRRKTNDYTIDYENRIVIGRATNTGKEFYIDLEDFDRIKELSWYESSVGYMHHKEHGEILQMHRIITNAPEGMVVDHINHNKLDNRKSNLRICTQAENCQNRKEEPKGISKIYRNDNVYYVVQIRGKYRGCFKDYEQAKTVRDKIFEGED